nr:ATP-binding protein [Streptomyces alkaliphilus]
MVSALATAVITFVLRIGETSERAPLGLLAVILGGALLLVCLIVAAAAYLAAGESRAQTARIIALRRHTARARGDLHEVVGRVERGEPVEAPGEAPTLSPSGGRETSLDLLAHEIAMDRYAAHDALARATAVVRDSASGSDEKVEVFGNLARRLQSLVHREIELLDELENEVEDPEFLKGLFQVDHLATRIRRYAENLAVLGGAVPRRQWTRPVGMTEVMRSAVAEVEHYSRVKLVPPIEGTLRGHVVADVIHLLAELVENATSFSSPQTMVVLRAQRVTAGLAVEVEDRGLGMPAEEQRRMNALLSGAERIDVGELLRDGRIGLFVVSQLARRHNIVVQLQSNIYGGIQAVLVLPAQLLGDDEVTSVESPGKDRAPSAVRAIDAVPGSPFGETPRAPSGDLPEGGSDFVSPAPGEPAPVAGTGHITAPPSRSHPTHPLPESSGDGRPDLPRRRRQQHLVPELRGEPSRRTPSPGGEVAHDPGLMAAFRRGAELAEDTGNPTAVPPVGATGTRTSTRGESTDHGE